MGRCYDPSGTIGHGCRDGMVRLREWARREFGGGDLGCFNPKSRAGGVPSLHADGRADDIAFNAKTPEGYAAGWRFFTYIIEHHNELGLQETLFAGHLWSCQNAHLGIRGPGIQQSAHMNHVHWGVTYEAANDWQESWLVGSPSPQPIEEEEDMAYYVPIEDNATNIKPAGKAVMLVDGPRITRVDRKDKPGKSEGALRIGAKNWGVMNATEFAKVFGVAVPKNPLW